MSFESLMKVIEDEINKIDYNSDIILTNTTTGKKLIIPKNTPKPTNFFNIPYDIRSIIYNKVRDLKRFYNYKLLDKGYLHIGEFITSYRLKLKKEYINFIDSDDEEEKQNIYDIYNKNDEINKNIEKLKNKIIENNKNFLSFKSNIIERREETKYYSSSRKKIIITYKIFYNRRIEDITNFIDNLNLNILENDDEYLKIKYNNYDILETERYTFKSVENFKDRINYLELYKKEFGEDDKIKKIMNDYKIEFDEYSRIHTEYMGERNDIYIQQQRENYYYDEYKKMFFDKVKLINCE